MCKKSQMFNWWMNEDKCDISIYSWALSSAESIRVSLTVFPPYGASSASTDSTNHGLFSAIVFTMDKYLH